MLAAIYNVNAQPLPALHKGQLPCKSNCATAAVYVSATIISYEEYKKDSLKYKYLPKSKSDTTIIELNKWVTEKIVPGNNNITENYYISNYDGSIRKETRKDNE
jgi:hypothetical protein